MAVVTGVKGQVTLPAGTGAPTTLHVTRWTGNIQRDVHDISVFQGTPDNARRKLGGLYHLTGTAEGFCDGTVNVSLVAAGSMTIEDALPTAGCVLQVTTSRTFTFSAIISNFRFAVDKGGQATLGIDFESSGEVTEA